AGRQAAIGEEGLGRLGPLAGPAAQRPQRVQGGHVARALPDRLERRLPVQAGGGRRPPPLPGAPRPSSASAAGMGTRFHTQYLVAASAIRRNAASCPSPRAARSVAPASRIST